MVSLNGSNTVVLEKTVSIPFSKIYRILFKY